MAYLKFESRFPRRKPSCVLTRGMLAGILRTRIEPEVTRVGVGAAIEGPDHGQQVRLLVFEHLGDAQLGVLRMWQALPQRPTAGQQPIRVVHAKMVHGSNALITPYPWRIVHLTLFGGIQRDPQTDPAGFIPHRDFAPMVAGRVEALREYAEKQGLRCKS